MSKSWMLGLCAILLSACGGGGGGGSSSPPPPTAPAVPTVVSSCTPSSGTAPLQVTCDASKSTESTAGLTLTYSWDFGDNSTKVTTVTASHTYSTAGNYTVTVTVSNGTNSASQSNTITVTAAPQLTNLQLTASPTEGVAPFDTTLTANYQSSNLDVTKLAFTYDFGDGTTQVTQSTATASHTYQTAGSYSAKLVVSYQNQPLTQPVVAAVKVDQPPPPPKLAVSLSSSSTKGVAPFTPKFTATVAGGAVGTSYSYVFTYNGKNAPSSSNPTAGTYKFTDAGTYQVTVTASGGGQSATSSPVTITVLAPPPPPPPPPTAVLTSDVTSGAPPLTVTFDASGSSTTHSGATLQYEFTFGDGTVALASTTAKVVHSYSTAGTYAATVTVIDGPVQTTSAPISITAGTPQLPAAQNLQGLYFGYYNSTDYTTYFSWQMLVDDKNNFILTGYESQYSYSPNFTYQDCGIGAAGTLTVGTVTGTADKPVTNFTATNVTWDINNGLQNYVQSCSFPDGSLLAQGTLTGLAQGSSVELNFALTSVKSLGVVTTPTQTWTLLGLVELAPTTEPQSVDNLYDGGYLLHSIVGPTVTVDAQGNYSYTDNEYGNTGTQCVFTGVYSVPNSAENIFDESGSITGCNSSWSSVNGLSYTGLALLYDPDPNSRRIGDGYIIKDGSGNIVHVWGRAFY